MYCVIRTRRAVESQRTAFNYSTAANSSLRPSCKMLLQIRRIPNPTFFRIPGWNHPKLQANLSLIGACPTPHFRPVELGNATVQRTRVKILTTNSRFRLQQSGHARSTRLDAARRVHILLPTSPAIDDRSRDGGSKLGCLGGLGVGGCSLSTEAQTAGFEHVRRAAASVDRHSDRGMCSWILSESAWNEWKHTHCALITVTVINPARGARLSALRLVYVWRARHVAGAGFEKETYARSMEGGRASHPMQHQVGVASPDDVVWRQVYKASTGNKITEIESTWPGDLHNINLDAATFLSGAGQSWPLILQQQKYLTATGKGNNYNDNYVPFFIQDFFVYDLGLGPFEAGAEPLEPVRLPYPYPWICIQFPFGVTVEHVISVTFCDSSHLFSILTCRLSAASRTLRMAPPIEQPADAVNSPVDPPTEPVTTKPGLLDAGDAIWLHANDKHLLQWLVEHRAEGGDAGNFKPKTFRGAMPGLEEIRAQGGPKTLKSCQQKYASLLQKGIGYRSMDMDTAAGQALSLSKP
ncbi:hypothetical protein C8R44DRAFT_747352 [Mycena epipterygia]|nr:hypothetical protein C8R44DRAFT_747352 [Mycena epipterygia]